MRRQGIRLDKLLSCLLATSKSNLLCCSLLPSCWRQCCWQPLAVLHHDREKYCCSNCRLLTHSYILMLLLRRLWQGLLKAKSHMSYLLARCWLMHLLASSLAATLARRRLHRSSAGTLGQAAAVVCSNILQTADGLVILMSRQT